ncbi:hypothetical protein RvY_17916 [Ramazzottius varieornatus]|uniref:Choline/carnitine acyltransferase domain-containing protein n=1 Tax=Ramazzottius varieornatus TaxID=947166 RepID=A0A1D1W3W1_RAMVA|nr:hypothetical protein RvY_17916 [Ramazzottius varieornatus]
MSRIRWQCSLGATPFSLLISNKFQLPLIRRCLQTRTAVQPARRDEVRTNKSRFGVSPRQNPYTHQLPHLPVPPLQQTLDKYFKSLEPLLSDGELQHTQKLLTAFARPGGDGEKLQQLLESRAEETENWLEEWWIQKAYLDSRVPLPVNVSPGIVFPQQSFAGTEGQLRAAAYFVSKILEFRELINSGQLEPDMMKKTPLDMAQYLKIFGSHRIPSGTHDEIFAGGENEERPYIVVIHKNSFFHVPIQSVTGQPYTVNEIFQHLINVVAQTNVHQSIPVGILTTLDRSAWARVYRHLQKKKHNRHVLNQIHHSLFVLCLDSLDERKSSKKSAMTDAARQVLHGNGSDANSGNRWFDKTLQLIVGANGVCGWNYEHTLIEGPPLFRMMEYVMKQTGPPYDFPSHSSGNMRNVSRHATAYESKPMLWELDEDVISAVGSAKASMDTAIKDVDLEVMEFTQFGKDFIKSRKISPDSFFQMALQLAFYRMYNQIPATYESASTRQFLGGRTETIRSASEESGKFVEAMVAHTGPSTVKKLLMEACDAHKKYAAEASNGQGVDRHLLGLKLTAIENGHNIPELLMDVGYTTSTHWKLSTSQGNSSIPAFMCYGPAVPDGYGCCYNPMADRIIAGVSATYSYAATHSGRFAETVADSLEDMRKTVM